LVEAALIDDAPQQHSTNANTTNRQQRRGFGQDVSADVQFNDEQKEQLRKLREEAVTAGNK